MSTVKLKYENQQYELEFGGDFIQEGVESTECFFELELLEQLRARVTSFDTVVDIGANVGNHTFYFSEICEAKTVYAFEPVEANFLLCKKNNPKASTYKVALSNYIGTCNLNNTQPWNSGTSFMVDTKDGDVEVKTLDWYKYSGVTFIKIDVEGAEVAVLQGARETIIRNQPELLVEVHNDVTVEDIMKTLPGNYSYEFLGNHHYFLSGNGK
jgi:FkbM family methyltransferase